MSSRDGPTMCGKRRCRRRDDDLGVVHAQRRLRQVGHAGRRPAGRGAPTSAASCTRRMCCRRLAHRAEHLVVALMADQDDGVAFPGEADRLEMDLGDQRAGGVDGAQAAAAAAAARMAGATPWALYRTVAPCRHLVDVDRRRRRRACGSARPPGGCGRSRGRRTAACRTVSSARSRLSIAMLTPAQKPRGLARMIFTSRPPCRSW